MLALFAFLAFSVATVALPDPKTGNNGKPIRLLFIQQDAGWGAKPEIDAAYREYLEQQGFDVTVILSHRMLSRGYLRQFNCVVVPGVSSAVLLGYHAPSLLKLIAADNNERLLREYVEGGGGLLYHIYTGDAGPACAAGMNRILKPYAISTRPECVRDPETDDTNLKEGTPGGYTKSYSWTEKIGRSPATKGVKRIYYPTAVTRWDDAYSTNPLLLEDPAWNALVRGGPQARTFLKTGTYVESWWVPGTVNEPPVIVAAREFGKGRIAVSGINPFYTVTYCSSTSENNGMECNTGAIDFITLRKGDGSDNSDGAVLFDNLHLWLAEPGVKQGCGQGDVAVPPVAMDAIFPDKNIIPGLDLANATIDWDTVDVPRTWATGVAATRWGFYPEVDDPLVGPEIQYFKILIGARSSYTTGKNTVAELAAAAREAGYSAIAFTEWFPELTYAEWQQLVADCKAATADDFVCLPGIDIEDENGIRYALIGQERYPFDYWLDPYRRLVRNQAVLMQFGGHFGGIHRGGTSPFDYRLWKHFIGVALENWGNQPRNYNKYLVPTTDWKLLDNAWLPYLWQAANESNPTPFTMKQVESVEDIPKAAANGMDTILPSDTIGNAVNYLCSSIGTWWDDPGRFFVSAGPLITRWSIRNKDEGVNPTLKRWRVGIGASSVAGLREVVLLDGFNVYRRWTPNANEFSVNLDGCHGMQHHFVLVVTDNQGRRAVSPTIRTVSMPGYFMRCGDRQNFFNTPMSYTGTRLPLFQVGMPVWGTVEGSSVHANEHGANGCPVGEFRFACNALNVTEATIDSRWAWATDAETCFDARPLYATTRTSVLDGTLRYLHLMGTPWIILEAYVRPRHPFVPQGRIWPTIGPAAGGGILTDPASGQDQDFQVQGVTPVLKGTWFGPAITLSDGLATDGRVFGFDAGTSGQPVRVTDRWAARFLVKKGGNSVFFTQNAIAREEALRIRPAMGLSGQLPYTVNTTQGRLEKVEVLAYLVADNGGVAGTISAADIGYPLPLHVTGVNPNVDFGVWRPDQPVIAQFGIFENAGWAHLDIAGGAEFYAGNLVLCDQPMLKISVPEWTAERILVQVNNPTDAEVTANIATPAAVRDCVQIAKTITVPAGSSIDVTN